MTADRLTGDCEIDCQTACAYPGRFSECSIGALAAAWDKTAAVDPLDGGAAGKSGTSAPTERPGDSPRPGRSLPDDCCPDCGEVRHERRPNRPLPNGQTFVFPERGRPPRRMVADEEVRPHEPLPVPEVQQVARRQRPSHLDPWDTDDSDDDEDRWQDALNPAQAARVRTMFDRHNGGGR